MLIELLKDIEQMDLKDYQELLFNLYEDKTEYTVEAVFDDDKLIIGRDNKIYAVADSSIDFKDVLISVENTLKSYFKTNKNKYKQFKSIAYGFVEGDLYYIKKPRKSKKEQVLFVPEDFYEFNAVKIKAWLTVYLNAEGKDKYNMEVFMTDFESVPKEKFEEWCAILAQYFDYDKYNRN